MQIDQLKAGQVAVVTAMTLDHEGEKRLREHGLDEGIEVELLHRAAFGADPIAIRVGEACVAIRRAQAACVTVALVSDHPAAALPVAAE
ncbi:MAG: FeoA family protein [Pseudomonadota bacterium]